MFIAVNLKDYKFGFNGCVRCSGFGMLNTTTNEFVSLDGKLPYALRTKKLVTACIEGGFPDHLIKRVKPN